MDEIDELIDDLISEVRDDVLASEWGAGYRQADVAGARRKLEEVIEALSGPKWIPVSERLPENTSSCYLVYTETDCGKSVDIGNFYGGELHANIGGTVTHWMPLPEPPEVK